MSTNRSAASRVALWIGFCAFSVIAAVFLWTEHRAHLIGAYEWLPWLVLLLCPVIHLFMHRSHGHHGGHHRSDGPRDETSEGGRS